MRRLLPLALPALLLLLVPLSLAAPLPQQAPYLALVPIVGQAPPTPIPTATPRPLPLYEDMVIRLEELVSGWQEDGGGFLTNEEAAASYRDPNAARRAFAEQGRLTSYVRYFYGPDRVYDGLARLSHQAIRYQTEAGAIAGQDYALPSDQAFGFRLVSFPQQEARTLVLVRRLQSGGFTFNQYKASVQKGQHLAFVSGVALASQDVIGEMEYYIQRAIALMP